MLQVRVNIDVKIIIRATLMIPPWTFSSLGMACTSNDEKGGQLGGKLRNVARERNTIKEIPRRKAKVYDVRVKIFVPSKRDRYRDLENDEKGTRSMGYD